MSRVTRPTILVATLIVAGSAYCLHAADGRKWPKATPPPPPSPIYHEVKEAMPSEQDIERAAAEHTARLQSEIERALSAGDEDRIQAVFVFLLPELLQVEPSRVVAMVAKQSPGKSRDRLRDAVARQWVVMDQPAATEWMKGLGDEDRLACAKQAITTLKPIDPTQATMLARDLSLDSAEETAKLLSSR